MSKVLIAAQILGLSTISLSIGSCNSNSHSGLNNSNVTSRENPTLSPISNVDETSSLEEQSQPTPIVVPSPVVSSPEIDPQVTKLASVPYVNPLNSISILAKQQIAGIPASKNRDGVKSPSSSNPNAQISNDLNLELEHLSNISAIPKIDRLAKHPRRKYLTNNQNFSPASCQAFPCLILTQAPSNFQNRFNNPIYKLIAYRDKTSKYTFKLDAVTGRGFTQARNRYQSNTEAPLPDGSYSIAAKVVTGTIREVGGTMVPIFPKSGFNPRMKRTALGIHWDPSFNKDKKEDGTSGCIGLTNKNDYHQVRDFVLKYHPRSLEVKITR
jgi:hypothetical protein